ncbi:MAG: tetratricopeptide repeat protein [Bacteroidota bacterium]|nr:tetratricopeptide repeat protein [Bacteroidota bacterium]
MNRIKRLPFLILLLCVTTSSYSQSLDSLKLALKSAKHDTIRCNILNELSETAPDEEWPKFNAELKVLCEKHLKGVDPDKEKYSPEERFYLRHLASALNNEGFLADQHGQTEKTLELYKKSLKIRENLKEKRAIANSLNNLGNVYEDLGDIPKALEYLHKSMKLQEETKDRRGQSYSLNNLATIYGDLGDKNKALEYYQKALQIQEEIKDKLGAAYSLSNIGYFYNKAGEIDKALEYYLRSLKIKEEIDDKYGIAYSYNNIGIIYKEKGDLKTALEYYNKSLMLREEIGEKNGIAAVLNHIAEIKLKMGEIAEAKKLGEQSLKLSKEVGYPDEIQDISKNLCEIYLKDGNYKGAYEMQVLFKLMSDSVNNENTKKASIQKSFQYEYDKKVAADSVKVAEEHKLFDAQIKQERTQRTALYVGIGLIGIFSLFMYNRFRVTRKQKNIIESQKAEVDKQRELADSRRIIAEEQRHVIQEKQKEILDSIHYASRIQKALLTSEEYISKHFPAEYFIFYQPKDIVSGDFYWALNHHNKFFIATSDCTGHGVPGAFMSLLNINFLNENVIERRIENPALILDEQKKSIIKALNPKGNENSKDGMDSVLCSYDLKNMKLNFAAANNPLWLVRPSAGSGTAELIEYKADKMAVGKGEENAKDFTLQTIDLQKGDIIYTFTDGYADQFGGPKGKKFLYKQFHSILLENHHLPMNEQKGILEKRINEWMGETEQIDDLLVIGVRI